MTYRWRPMTEADLGAVERIANVVHPGFFERREVLAEKRRLYPKGAFLCETEGGPGGYLLSHPWLDRDVPALDTPLGAVPAGASTYYIHDLALLPQHRGIGAAGAVVRLVLAHGVAAGFRTASLVAVNESQAFWEVRGFAVVDIPSLAGKLAGYEPAARYMSRTLQ